MVITIANAKGGTAKSVTAAVLAQAAIYKGLSVLVVDMDAQGNCSFAIGANTHKKGSFEFLNGAPAADVIQHTEQGIDIIPASWNLATLTSERGSARRLQRALEPIKGNYDICIIDTPPTIGEALYNALQASTGLVIPLLADTFNVQSFYQITDTAQQIKQSNPELTIKGIVFTLYDKRSTVVRQMRKAIEEKAKGAGVPCLGEVRAAVVIKEATALQQSLYQYAPRSKPAADYLQILDRIL